METERRKGTGPKLFSKTVTRTELQRKFYLPMEEAGKRWGVSTTIIKRVCRKFGIERWPYRQIQSAQKKIAALEDMLRTRTRTSAEQEKVKSEIRALDATINDLLVNPNTPEKSTPMGGSGSRRPTSTARVPTPAPARGPASTSSGGGRSNNRTSIATSHSASEGAGAGDNQMAVGNVMRDGCERRSGEVRHGVGVVSEDPLRTAALRKHSRAAAKMMRSPAAAAAVAVSTGRHCPQDTKRSLTRMPTSMAVRLPTTTTSGGVTGDRLRFPKRVKTGEWMASAGTPFGIPGATNASHGMDRMGFGGYNPIPQVRANRLAMPNGLMQVAVPNGLMQVAVPPPPPRASGVARRPHSLTLGAFEGSARVLEPRWPTTSNVAHGRDSLRYDRSVQTLAGDRSAWPSVGRARLGHPSTEAVCSSDMVTVMPGPDKRDGGRFPIIPPRSVLPVAPEEKQGGGCVSALDEQTEAYLDDCGLLALVLKIPQACDSGEGTSGGSSSWGALSGGSYLNTEEAFAAFATTTSDDVVPGGH